MKIQIALSDGEEHAWFNELTKEEKKAYIDQHPNSQFAKKGLVEKVKKGVKNILKAEHEFFHGEGHVAGSEPRRSMGKFLKAKLHGAIKGLKHEVKEFKTAGYALVSLAKGKEISKHEKAAIKTVLIHSLMVVGPMAVSGGLSAGLVHALPHLAHGFLEHTLVIAAGRAAIFASETETDPDKLMVKLVDKFADYVANADISKDEWKAAFAKSGK